MAIQPATTICGAAVIDCGGDTLGSITELMIDVGTGAITYAVLSYGGVLGVGEKLFAIPWSAFTFDTTNESISVAIERDRLDALPGFDKDAWPIEADSDLG